MKFMVTGLLLMLTASIIAKSIGKYPGPVVGVPIIFAFIGSTEYRV